MEKETIRDIAATVAAGAGVLLLADLSLGWHEVNVSTGGLVGISATASAWNGAGLVAGLLTIAMLVAMIRPLAHEGAVTLTEAAVVGVLGLGALAFTIAAAFTGSASVTAPAAAVEVGTTLWPAYAGIAVAAVVAGGGLTALVLVLRGAVASSRLAHA